jgi:hypothetical protein
MYFIIKSHLRQWPSLSRRAVPLAKVNTLVLVHREQLRDQWQERLAFLDPVPEVDWSYWRRKGGRTGRESLPKESAWGLRCRVWSDHRRRMPAEGIYTPRRTSIATSVIARRLSSQCEEGDIAVECVKLLAIIFWVSLGYKRRETKVVDAFGCGGKI